MVKFALSATRTPKDAAGVLGITERQLKEEIERFKINLKNAITKSQKILIKLRYFKMSELEEKKKRKKAGSESSKNLLSVIGLNVKEPKERKGGWVDCNAPDGKGGYKSCGRSSGEKRKKYPACRPTPGACKERGRGKSWGKDQEKEE